MYTFLLSPVRRCFFEQGSGFYCLLFSFFFFEQRPIQLGSDEVKNDNRGLKLRFDILEDRERETRLKIG